MDPPQRILWSAGARRKPDSKTLSFVKEGSLSSDECNWMRGIFSIAGVNLSQTRPKLTDKNV